MRNTSKACRNGLCKTGRAEMIDSNRNTWTRLPRLVSNAASVYREIRRQKKFNSSFLAPLLDELEQACAGKFTREQRQKISVYYGLYIPSFLCSSYKILYGGKLQNAERRKACWFAILTAVGDDLTDIDLLPADELLTLTLNPADFSPQTFLARVARTLQLRMIEKVSDLPTYLQDAQQVWQAQKNSELQRKPLDWEDLRRITFDKGAASVVVYHHCLDRPLTEPMRNLLRQIGGLYQWGNDLFDVYKDLREGVYTMPILCTDFPAMKKAFLAELNSLNLLLHDLDFAPANIRHFKMRIHAINARSLVALDYFIALGGMDLRKASRSQLIVDMEKPRNFLQWLKYSLELG